MSEIDSRAIVSSSARLGKGIRIGSGAVVEDEVELGDGCILEAHAVVRGDPQDYTYTGQRVSLEVGDENEFREFSTVNRGTIKGGGVTRVGNHNLIMSYAHIGHDCVIGDYTTLINGAQLAGHIHVEDYATISSFCLLHQFSRIGRHSYIGAGTIITQDVAPFSMIVGPRENRCYGINKVGLERRGFSPDRIQAIEQAYRYLLRSKLNTSQAIEKMRGTLSNSEDVQMLIRFIESTTDRGLTK
jgi:UDP-N-acetylglucosamine acyltransferase